MNRTKSSIKNLIYAFSGQIIGILTSLVARFVFIKILTSEYLGLNGLFSNILSLLTLAELGVGTAMTYSLYKPLANNDKEKVKSLMNVYKISYRIIGIIIFILGLSLIPFLPKLINNMPDISNINIIYALFVINSSVSYFYSYKRSLIISDQKRYIATLYRYGFYCLLQVVQILVLLITHNYIIFLCAQIMITLLENILISKKADQMYPYLKENNIQKLDKETKISITKNVSSMTFHKIGGIVVNSTDNLIMSKYVGLLAVGIYSNYYLVIHALSIVLGQIFASITASVGNLAATEDKQKLYNVFKNVFFLDFWIYSFSAVCLITLFNDFITLWLGADYTFDFLIVLVIVIQFYFTGMRQATLTYRDALGMYWQDRYKPIFESVINIIVSIVLAKKMGVAGVFIGTIISTITTCFWIEPYVLYKYGLEQKVLKYFIKYGIYTVIGLIVAAITFAICNTIKDITIINFIIKMIICLIVPNLIFYIIFKNTEEFKYYLDLIKNIVPHMKNK